MNGVASAGEKGQISTRSADLKAEPPPVAEARLDQRMQPTFPLPTPAVSWGPGSDRRGSGYRAL